MSEAQPSGMKDEDLPAVFWDEMPANKNNADLAAINALIEEQTPEERAESHKVRIRLRACCRLAESKTVAVSQNQGNEALKTGLKHRKKFYFRQATIAYTKGLDACCGNDIINAVLLSNRAQVHLILGNDRNALEDSLAAMKLDDNNVKVAN